MRLWPETFEALRSEAFAAAEQVYGAMPGDGVQPDVDPYDGILAARAGGDELFPYRCPSASDRLIDGVRCRIIEPEGEVRGVYLHFHGGGMAIGTPELNDDENEVLARELGVVTVSVDYRLAPEHPYPAAIEDALAVAGWLIANSSTEFGTERLILGGESSGAYLAAMTLLGIRDLDSIDRVVCANLVFGVFDWGRSPSQRGFRAQSGPDWLAPEAMAQFADFYLPGRTDDQRRDPTISPAFAELHSMPPALFTIGTLDHMFDDTIMTAARWSAAGNETALAVYPDCGHGFHWFTDTELKRIAVQRIHDFLAEKLSRS
jgi:acetyl esterase